MKTNGLGSTRRHDALLQVLRSADTLWEASRVFFARWDLGPSQFNALNLLYLQPDGLSQTDLSRQLIMHRSNVTGLVDRLEQRGLVSRHEVAGDRRAYRVVLTRTGEDLVKTILPAYHRGVDRVWEKLPAGRAEQLITDLQRVAENARKIVAENPD